MSDNENEVTPESELEVLKQRANMMNISFHPAIGVKKLRAKVNAELNPEAGKEDSDDNEAAEKAAFEREWKAKRKVKKETNKPPLSEADKKRMLHTRLRKEANRLIRVRITCMNPNKKNWTGEIVSVSNAVIGTVKKFVPFNIEEGYHIPAVILKMLKAREYQHFAQVKMPNGQKKVVVKLLPEFAIEVMTPLNEKELNDLKQQQALNHSID